MFLPAHHMGSTVFALLVIGMRHVAQMLTVPLPDGELPRVEAHMALLCRTQPIGSAAHGGHVMFE